jgi:hypothetical protein
LFRQPVVFLSIAGDNLCIAKRHFAATARATGRFSTSGKRFGRREVEWPPLPVARRLAMSGIEQMIVEGIAGRPLH